MVPLYDSADNMATRPVSYLTLAFVPTQKDPTILIVSSYRISWFA